MICELINKYIPTITTLGTRIVNALRQWKLKHYRDNIIIGERNLSINFNDHLFPDIRLYE